MNIKYNYEVIRMTKKIHVIPFRTFMSGEYKAKPTYTKVYTVSPLMMIEPTILIAGGIILSLALLEKYFERTGNYDIAEGIHTVFNLAIPAIAFGFIWKLLQAVSGAFL